MAETQLKDVEQVGQERWGRQHPMEMQRGGSPQSHINVGEQEQQLSILAGITLLLVGLFRRGFGSVLFGGIGALLIERGVTGHCSLYQSLGASSAGQSSHRSGSSVDAGTKVSSSITIDCPREQVFAFCRDLRNLPRFMKRIERIDVLDDKRSHWVAKGPGGKTMEWDARITDEHPNEMIAWESLPGKELPSSGSIWFVPSPDGKGTLVKVSTQFHRPSGAFEGSPEQELDEELMWLKNILEKREQATSTGAVQAVIQRAGRS